MIQDFRIIFIDKVHPILFEMLSNAGFLCEHAEEKTAEEIISVLPNFHGFILRSKVKLNAQILSSCPQLRFIGRVGAGMENIDVPFAEKRGIACLNSPEGNRDAVAEHALGMLLALMNNLCRANRQVREGIWLREENRGTEIGGKVAGIIGVGNMGTAFAKRLTACNVKVLGYDKYKTGYSSDFVQESDMETLFEKADIISLHLPLTHETSYLADSDFFSRLKNPVWFVNTSRGKVLNTEALVASIRSGRVLGAALDVLEYEKFSFEEIESATIPEPLKYLFSCDNVIFSPHIAGWTHESDFKLSHVLAEKIIRKFAF